MKLELEVSDKNEGTDSPYWLILDPRQMLSLNHNHLAGMITGPFFSREEAQDHLDQRHYAFTSRAAVYCCSGYHARQYKDAYRNAQTTLAINDINSQGEKL